MSSPSTAFQWREGTEAAVAQSVSAFNAFLRQAKSDVHSVLAKANSRSNALPKVVHVMIGNEAADADSIVSSLVYAHFKHHNKAFDRRDHTDVYVPVLSIPREELVLRCDVSSLFAKLQIDLDALVFVDEFPWQHAAFSGNTKSAILKLTLLDHNALNTKRMAISQIQQQAKSEIGQVVEILDHHMDLGKHPAAPVREIAFANGQALVASNCTLVAEKILAANCRDDEVFALSATLLLAVIALDSINFNPSAKKVTARDIHAANELEKTSFATKEALFEWLQAEKFNPKHWDAFSVRNCLQCDYKEFQLPSKDTTGGGLYGVSAILIDLERFVKKESASAALVEQLQAFAQENGVAFLLVMTMFVDSDGERRRQLLFYDPSSSSNENANLVSKCVQFLEMEGSLALERLDLPAIYADARLQTFNQRNTGASRKQVVPLLQQALEASKTESKY